MTAGLTSAVTGAGEITLMSRLAGSPSEAWQLLTDPARLPGWLGDPITFELEIGGRIEVEVEGGYRFRGTFVAIEPPHRLVLTWGWSSGPVPIAPGSTRVEIRLRPSGTGSELQLVHTGLGAWAERNLVGWSRKLARLQDLSPVRALP